ncbi:MAG: apolipoprotein N-acyltransferase [Spirochaetes bacterium]|nr:apolipoprotein N-acyltransferase [Spirochaetota bacterium]
MDVIIRKKIKSILFYHKVILYFLLGILWALAQMTYSFPLLTWFALVPFLFTIKYEETKYALFYSIIFGATTYLFNLWWMPFAVSKILIASFPNKLFIVPVWLISILIYVFVSIYHGFVYVIIYYIVKILSKTNHYIFYLVFPLAATVFDYFYPKLWHDQIGYSQFVFFHFSQVSDVFGVPFITYIVLCSNTAIIIFIESFIYYKYIMRSFLLVLGITMVIIAVSIYGIFRYDYIMDMSEKAEKVKIGIIQGNFTGLDKFDEKKYQDMIKTYNDLSKSILIQNPDLIIWPEGAVPYIINTNVENYNMIKNFKNVPLITGITLSKDENKITKYFNSMVYISGNNKLIDYYNKNKLIPFAENSILPFMNNLNLIGYINYSKGTEPKLFEYGKIKISPNICYEAIFDNFIRKSLEFYAKDSKEANLIINATNDSWFGKSVIPEIHMHMSGFRSIENRKSLIRVTGTGHSAYFNPGGDIIYISELFKQDSSVLEVPLIEFKTIYRKWGWLFIWILLFLLIIIIIIVIIRITVFRYNKSVLIKKKIHSYNLKKMWLE